MNDWIFQGVDLQLKILQTLLCLITNFSTIYGRLTCRLCNDAEFMRSVTQLLVQAAVSGLR